MEFSTPLPFREDLLDFSLGSFRALFRTQRALRYLGKYAGNDKRACYLINGRTRIAGVADALRPKQGVAQNSILPFWRRAWISVQLIQQVRHGFRKGGKIAELTAPTRFHEATDQVDQKLFPTLFVFGTAPLNIT